MKITIHFIQFPVLKCNLSVLLGDVEKKKTKQAETLRRIIDIFTYILTTEREMELLIERMTPKFTFGYGMLKISS